MNTQHIELMKEIEEKIILWRHTLHRYPETAWCEFYTSHFIIKTLKELGYKVIFGQEIHTIKRNNLPSDDVLDKAYSQAIDEGADKDVLGKMKGGFTGAVGEICNGKGPTIALRFDIDGLAIQESDDDSHLPKKLNYKSKNSCMHACGHDAHTAIGLGIAMWLANNKQLIKGKIKLIFQPAEEVASGARSMIQAGILDQVDYIVSGHIGIKACETETLVCGVDSFLYTERFNAQFKGNSSHAAAKPEEGNNAILGAAHAIIALQGISRHSQGMTRINVGLINGGQVRNVIADHCYMEIETRASDEESNKYMKEEAFRKLEASAAMHNLNVEIEDIGNAISAPSNQSLVNMVKQIAIEKKCYNKIIDEKIEFGASEDFPEMMAFVQKQGGKAVYMLYGTELKDNHHNCKFDIDENSLLKAVEINIGLIQKLFE